MSTPLAKTCTIIATVSALSLMSACEFRFNDKEQVASNVKITSEKRALSGFDAISNSTPFDLIVTVEGEPSVEVVGAEKLVSQVETVVEGKNLIVRYKQSGKLHLSWQHKPLTVNISMPNLRAVNNSGSG
ncbi:MAG: DUF2807 domain-containing protein, partial [Burkholderiales bacterium]|nr:DUF2807 domain-containing protein [Burkholderiales bacterium]